MNKLFIFVFVLALLTSCGGDKKAENHARTKSPTVLQQKAQSLFTTLPRVAENPANPLSEQKIALGKKLYFDVRLSKDNTQSCNTCHNLSTFGVDNQSFSKGNDGKPGGRNSPTTLNAALHFAQFWDGREPDVEAQAGGPVLNPVEMAMPDEKAVEKRLAGIDEYVKMFAEAFPGEKKPLSFSNMAKAIGAFERTLITPSRFDDYLAGDDSALNDTEKAGLETYINSGCTTCHAGNLLGGTMYQKFGLFGNYWEYTKSKKIDNGRFDVTGNEADKYFFKVPSLRNIEKTYPYFHDGSVDDLREAVDIMAKSQLNKTLSDKELDDIVAFLKSLTGKLPELN